MKLGIRGKALLLFGAVALVPLAVAFVLVSEITEVSARVAEGEVDRLRAPLAHARDAYREAVQARKDGFRAAAALAATDPGWVAHCAEGAPAAAAEAALGGLLARDTHLQRAALVVDGTERAVTTRAPGQPVRELELEEPVAGGGDACRLRLVYGFPARLLDEQQVVGEALREGRALALLRPHLPRSTWVAFALLFGGVVLAVTALALIIAQRTARRLDRLEEGTRRVADGDLDARVEVKGDDEIADLSRAFNAMVEEMKGSRAQIEYLQKIGAWQEVARRLAHEIKNPLTPIQLAVQQLRSKYDGSDARFGKMLDDASEIVTEEVAGLRRLVDNFSSFAKLPRVEPTTLDLATVVDDVAQAAPAGSLEVAPPLAPVHVAGDRLLLRRALSNLVDNAREAGAKKARVSWAAEAGRARLVVDDDGPGVPADVRGKIFDPYVTTKEHGTGLGLAIVKKTLLEHGGDVELDAAPSPLGGARFVVELPLAAPARRS